jgi:hypothetical protein
MKKLILLVALVLPLALATAASASGPVITSFTRDAATPSPFGGGNCGSFVVLFTAHIEGTNISFQDDQGQLVKQIRHVHFTGTLYNSSDLSKSVPYEGAFTRTFEAATNTATLTGLRFKVQLPGEGVVALDTGQEVIVGPTLVSDTGNTFSNFVADVCAALA